ncbi:YqfO family protein [Teredinibacter haidensis]|uniref:Nif3-like dinuclear metal center hexameric protein n=1 Tax=Teredinibacter haidensis TaxID=2731755 RepID=UPI000948AF9B|nr:YqfO family protein [Teredinibacter haidensis]
MVLYQLVFYVPKTYVESVKSAVFSAGAGKSGDYDHCSWQVLGQGQFRPLLGSSPFLGNEGNVETVEEYRVEMVMAAAVRDVVIAALKQAHPYEEPAYSVWPLET